MSNASQVYDAAVIGGGCEALTDVVGREDGHAARSQVLGRGREC